MNYLANDFSIDLPDVGFTDHTNHVFEAKLGDGEIAGFVVTREPMPPGKTLQEAANQRILEEAKRFVGYSVIGERDAALGAGLVREVRARWRHDGSTVYQRQAHVVDGGVWMILSMRTPFHAQASCDAWMDGVVASLQTRPQG